MLRSANRRRRVFGENRSRRQFGAQEKPAHRKRFGGGRAHQLPWAPMLARSREFGAVARPSCLPAADESRSAREGQPFKGLMKQHMSIYDEMAINHERRAERKLKILRSGADHACAVNARGRPRESNSSLKHFGVVLPQPSRRADAAKRLAAASGANGGPGTGLAGTWMIRGVQRSRDGISCVFRSTSDGETTDDCTATSGARKERRPQRSRSCGGREQSPEHRCQGQRRPNESAALGVTLIAIHGRHMAHRVEGS